MSEIQILKPLKTWSHLASRRRKPSEYEIVSTNLHFSTHNPDAPFELDPNFDVALWFKKNRNASPMTHADWDAFRDPDEVVYRTYNMQHDGDETYVFGLFNQFAERGQDQMLEAGWIKTLARLYSPARYPIHAMQMQSAYLSQMAPASTISNCATYQTGDNLRWLTHTAYRTRELANAYPECKFGTGERDLWEKDEAWQGFRELAEKALVAWDWAESFVVLNLIVKPAYEECVLRGLGEAARHNGDILLGLLSDAQLRDAERHRRWATALIQFALNVPENKAVIAGFIAKWMPLADKAISAYSQHVSDVPGLRERAIKALQDFHRATGATA
jgi:toluene monooxygenase system protein E